MKKESEFVRSSSFVNIRIIQFIEIAIDLGGGTEAFVGLIHVYFTYVAAAPAHYIVAVAIAIVAADANARCSVRALIIRCRVAAHQGDSTRIAVAPARCIAVAVFSLVAVAVDATARCCVRALISRCRACSTAGGHHSPICARAAASLRKRMNEQKSRARLLCLHYLELLLLCLSGDTAAACAC